MYMGIFSFEPFWHGMHGESLHGSTLSVIALYFQCQFWLKFNDVLVIYDWHALSISEMLVTAIVCIAWVWYEFGLYHRARVNGHECGEVAFRTFVVYFTMRFVKTTKRHVWLWHGVGWHDNLYLIVTRFVILCPDKNIFHCQNHHCGHYISAYAATIRWVSYTIQHWIYIILSHPLAHSPWGSRKGNLNIGRSV